MADTITITVSNDDAKALVSHLHYYHDGVAHPSWVVNVLTAYNTALSAPTPKPVPVAAKPFEMAKPAPQPLRPTPVAPVPAPKPFIPEKK